MEAFISITLLAALGAGQLYIGELARDFIATLPADERSRIEGLLNYSD